MDILFAGLLAVFSTFFIPTQWYAFLTKQIDGYGMYLSSCVALVLTSLVTGSYVVIVVSKNWVSTINGYHWIPWSIMILGAIIALALVFYLGSGQANHLLKYGHEN